jgi:hypothetical protein
MEIGLPDIQRELRSAFEGGLRRQYGDLLGKMLADVAAYRDRALVVAYRDRPKLTMEWLRQAVDNDAAALVSAIIANRMDASMMMMIREQMIGNALLNDRDAVVRWATEGLNRCKRVGGPWAETEAQWKLVLDDPARYMLYSRQVKYFMNQI